MGTQVFCYDDLNRLTWAGSTGTPACSGAPTPSDTGSLAGTGAAYSASYSYDTLNRLTSSPLGSYTYGDSAHVDVATSIGSGSSTRSASYDASGAMTCRAPSGATTCAGTATGNALSYNNGTLPTSCGYTVQRAGANFALAVMFTQPAAAGAGEAVNAAVSVGVNASPKICIATCASPSPIARHMYFCLREVDGTRGVSLAEVEYAHEARYTPTYSVWTRATAAAAGGVHALVAQDCRVFRLRSRGERNRLAAIPLAIPLWSALEPRWTSWWGALGTAMRDDYPHSALHLALHLHAHECY